MDRDQEFEPIRDPRERSLDRDYAPRQTRYRTEDAYRETAIDGEPYSSSSRYGGGYGASRDSSFVAELQTRLNELQSQYGSVKRELDATTHKLGSSMHSIKTFWSPELKKERALRKEEAAKYALINDQLKILRSENQKQSALIRQLEEELRMAHMRNPDTELQQHLDALYAEKEHMAKEIYLLRETIKELELRIETQKQTLASRDESIQKLMEMLQNKGVGSQVLDEQRIEMERLKSRLVGSEARARHLETMLETRERDVVKMDELRMELNKREQEVLAMGAKMKTLEEQHHDYQRHIAVLKESLCAKEEHYNMLQTDVEELRQRLEEKNKLIEKKTQQAMQTSQERSHISQELQELRDHVDIKDRKINVLQRKIENLEDLLKEKDTQVDMARARLSAIQAQHSSSEGTLTSLEEAIADKERQAAQLREQRDRAEQERNEERELHERELAEYRMRMRALESDDDKLRVRLEKAATEKERLEAKLEASQSELGQARAELDRLQGETEIQSLRNRPQGNPKQEAELDAARKKLEEKQRSLEEIEKKLKKRKEKLDEMEASLKKAQANSSETEQDLVRQLAEMKMRCADLETRQGGGGGSGASEAELERLLQIMSSLEAEKIALTEQIKGLQDALKDRDVKLSGAKRNQQADKTRSAQMLDEARRREGDMSREASKAQERIVEQRDRIAMLEEALEESVAITTESEAAVVRQRALLEAADEEVARLQSEVRALQNGHNARCTSCPALKLKLKDIGAKLETLDVERRRHLEELFDMKLEALSAAVSEKDAHVALLEMSGIKNAQTAQELDKLRAEKNKLVDRIRTENERRVKLLSRQEENVTEKKEDVRREQPKPDEPRREASPPS